MKKGLLINIAILIGVIFMIIQKVWFPAEQDEVKQKEITQEKKHIPYNAIYEKGFSSNEMVIKDHADLTDQDIASNFFGYLRAQQYEKAALMFETSKYMAYFFRDYQELQDYIDQLNAFGDTLTKDQQLLTVQLLRSEQANENEMTQTFECYYKDDMKNKVMIRLHFVLQESGHDNEKTWFIADSVEDVMNQINPKGT